MSGPVLKSKGGSGDCMSASCSARLVQPFLKFAAAERVDRELVPRDFLSASADGRVSLVAAHAMLDRGIERFRDEQLGLKLGRSMCFGEGGPFDYAVRSAATLRESVDVAARYSRLLTDSFLIWLEAWRGQAVIRLSDETSWTRASADFAMGAFYKIHLADEVPAASQLECWFPYSMPRDVSEYQKTFANVMLKFGAPFFGFAFNRAYEKAPMPGADSVLHSVHCDRVDSLLCDLSVARAVKTRVRRLIEQEIHYARSATVPSVARALRMSRRTMSRRLEQEGTSFAEELDNARRELALNYVHDGDTPLKEVAFRLGFSHAESFHRAFKRWTGETPLTYRRRSPASSRPMVSSPLAAV
jgi:AraC-like DNA-binding protein